MDEGNKKESLFNAGLAKLERIHEQKRIMYMARIHHEWPIFADCLTNIRTELNERMDTTEREIGNKHEKEINEVITDYKRRKKNKILVDINVKPLKAYERFLCDLEYKYGMSMPDKLGAGHAAGLI